METILNTRPTQETHEWVTQAIRSMDGKLNTLQNRVSASTNVPVTAFWLGQITGINETITSLLNALNQE